MPGFVVMPLIVATLTVGCLAGCAEPAVLRAGSGGATMPEPASGTVPMPAFAEPTGGPLIALPPARPDGPTAVSPLSPAPLTPTATPRSGPGGRP